MGALSSVAHNVNAHSLAHGNTWWAVLGRPKYLVTMTHSIRDYTWDPPPPESTSPGLNVNWPDEDMQSEPHYVENDEFQVGIKRASAVRIVKPDPMGTIVVDGVSYRAAEEADLTARHVYWRFVVEDFDFREELGFDNIEAYSRVSLVANIKPDGAHANSFSIRGMHIAVMGKLYYFKNISPAIRNHNEQHIIQIVLET